MSDLMYSAHLLATDSVFRATCRTDPKSALTQRGLVLTKAELEAFRRVWASIAARIEGDGKLPIDLPMGHWK